MRRFSQQLVLLGVTYIIERCLTKR